MTSSKRELDVIAAPYGREIRLTEVDFESGMRLLRVSIREGARYTILEIDAPTAAQWSRAMREWSEAQTATKTPPGS